MSRSAAFTMAGFETQAAIASAIGRGTDLFDQLTEDGLDTLYRPLVYLMEAGERGLYEDLSVDGKRNYLRQFWARRDPSPDRPGNEFQDQFYRLIARASRDFREGGAAEVPGWLTDRGRIFVRYGEPDEVLRRPQSGTTNPYEAWKYTRGRLRKFVFYDETGVGNYALIWTNEQREPSRANWMELLEIDMVELKVVKIKKPEDVNIILGQSHFIKTVEDLCEALVSSVPGIKFGLAFVESSGACKVRSEGTDPELKKLAEENALEIGAGHSFIVMLKNAFPINVLNAVKAVPEVCSIYCATANPVEVVIAETDTGRGIMGIIDGLKPKGIESVEDIQWRKGFLRKIGYKL